MRAKALSPLRSASAVQDVFMADGARLCRGDQPQRVAANDGGKLFEALPAGERAAADPASAGHSGAPPPPHPSTGGAEYL